MFSEQRENLRRVLRDAGVPAADADSVLTYADIFALAKLFHDLKTWVDNRVPKTDKPEASEILVYCANYGMLAEIAREITRRLPSPNTADAPEEHRATLRELQEELFKVQQIADRGEQLMRQTNEILREQADLLGALPNAK